MSTQGISPIRMAAIGMGLFAFVGVMVIDSSDGPPGESAEVGETTPRLARPTGAPEPVQAPDKKDGDAFDAWVDGDPDSEEAIEEAGETETEAVSVARPAISAPPPVERQHKSDTPGSKILYPDPRDERGSHDNAGDNIY